MLGMQTPGAVAERLALLTAATGGDPHAFDRYMASAFATTKDDIARVAKMLTITHRNMITLSPPKAPSAKTGAK